MTSRCKICGNEDDLYLACTDDGVCSVCTMKFFGGAQATPDRIANLRARIGLSDGQLL